MTLKKLGWKGRDVVEWQQKRDVKSADRKDKNEGSCLKILGRKKIILDILGFLRRQERLGSKAEVENKLR